MAAKQTTTDAKEQNAFTMHCWHNEVEEVRRILAVHPEAVHWRHHKTGDTGLTHVAALGIDDCRVATLLLDGGADVNAQNDNGWTPLMLATLARNGSAAHVALLLDRGADLTIRNSEGKTAEEIAKSIGRPEIAAEFDQYRVRAARKAQEASEARNAREVQAQVETLQQGTQTPVTVRKKPLKLKF